MREYDAEEAAQRAGVPAAYVRHLADLGILTAGEDGTFSVGDVRKIQVVHACEEAGVSLEGLAAVIKGGSISLHFIEAVGYEVIAPLTGETFTDVSSRTGVPVELLQVVREAVGGVEAKRDDRMREDELGVLPLIELQLAAGFRPIAIERGLRVLGDSLRRIAETEAEWFRTEIVQPRLAAGLTENDVGKYMADFSPRLSAMSVDALVAIYHAQQRHAWMTNIITGLAGAVARAGMQTDPERRQPAMCFLDITGYTRLTQEQATKLGRSWPRRSPGWSIGHRSSTVDAP